MAKYVREVDGTVMNNTIAAAEPQANVWERLKMHPTGFWYVFWGEMAERTSFYGMRTILALYLITVLGFQRDTGASVMQFFIAACYLAPLLGGWLADRVLGRYKTILYFCTPYIMGHLILGGIQNRWGLFVALGLLALGSGTIKPNTSTLMGMMYEQQKKSFLLTEAFSYFYAAVNIGAAVSGTLLPMVRDKWGYGVALTIPAVLMALAFFFFALGKKHYPQEDVHKHPPKTAEQKQAERLTLRRIAGIFALISVFWLVYDQSASTWIYFTKDHCDLTLFPGLHVTPDQIQALNAYLIVILTPIFNAIWEHMKRRGGREVPDTRKMLIGFIIVIGCMALMAVAGFLATAGNISVWWVVIATFIVTLSELCISVVGLEFAFKQAAPGTKSVVTAAFLLTVTVGDFAGGLIDRLYETSMAAGPYFALQTAIMLVTAIIFIRVARRFESDESVAVARG